MTVQGSSAVASRDLQRANEVHKAQNADQVEKTERTDDSRDRVTISDEAKDKKRMSEDNEYRVDSGQRTVDSGGQDVDSMKVAKKVLDEM